MNFVNTSPTFTQKLDAVRDAISWAGGIKCVHDRQPDGERVREANQVWGELHIVSIVTENPIVAHIDDDNEAGDSDTPRQDAVLMTCVFNLQLNVCSRDQRPEKSGWMGALLTEMRMKYPYVEERWLDPNGIKVLSTEAIVDGEIVVANRVEDRATMEFSFETRILDCDPAARGTWIETVEISSELEDIDDSLNLDEEIMP